MYLLLRQQCAAVWGTRAIGKCGIEAQAAHLGDEPGGGLFFRSLCCGASRRREMHRRRIGPPNVSEWPSRLGRVSIQDVMEAKGK